MSVDKDVEEIKAVLGEIADRISKLSLPTQVELAAQLRAVSQSSTQMVDGWYRGDVLTKPGLRQMLRAKAKRGTKGMIVLGNTMQATFSSVTMQVLDQKALRVVRPDVAEEFTRPIHSERLSFTLRTR
jgi:hypothetical protein